jgi:hypothetical protein
MIIVLAKVGGNKAIGCFIDRLDKEKFVTRRYMQAKLEDITDQDFDTVEEWKAWFEKQK